MEYESDILKRLIKTYGVVGNPRYISEIIKEFIVQGKERFPELFTYQADWLAHIDEFGLNPSYTVSYTGQSIYAPNTLERPVKSAILSGSTKYHDIDTGEFLETFEEDRNLELVSVKMPDLTTSNEDGTKTNILSTPSDLELRGIGDVQDELNLLTGEVTQRIGKMIIDGRGEFKWGYGWNDYGTAYPLDNPVILDDYNFKKDKNFICEQVPTLDHHVYSDRLGIAPDVNRRGLVLVVPHELTGGPHNVDGLRTWLNENPLTVFYEFNTESIKTVDFTILDQNGQNVKQLMSFNGGTHFNTGSLEGSPLPSVSVSVETDLVETLKVCSLEGNTM